MAIDSGLVGHWTLDGNFDDRSGNGNHGRSHGAVAMTPPNPIASLPGTAQFDGRSACITVPHNKTLALGTADFSIAAWVNTNRITTDVPGDILSKFCGTSRRGFNFGIQTAAGVASSQSNWRNVFFGIDDEKVEPDWTNNGRPGNAQCVMGLAVHAGSLYAGTYEGGAAETGHVYRFAGGAAWEACGAPADCNAVSTLAVYDGDLYAGVSCYRAQGSSLPESPNRRPGGSVYRYAGGKEWVDCGQLGDAEDVFGLAVYDGELYGSAMYSAGMFKYAGGKTWLPCGDPGTRVAVLGVFQGGLYATGYDVGGVFRYEGAQRWSFCGNASASTQLYSFASYRGLLHTGVWPSGSVYRQEDGLPWLDCGRLGEELEVMGMMVYNGKLYAGTLPTGSVYRYDSEGQWVSTGQLDTTPDVKYRRAWTMAVYQGRLFCGTLPSGNVLSLEAGKNVTHDHALPGGWHHLTAVRADGLLRLYVDGALVATSPQFEATDYDLSTEEPLHIGFGAIGHFSGSLGDVRLYNRALADTEVTAIFERPRL